MRIGPLGFGLFLWAAGGAAGCTTGQDAHSLDTLLGRINELGQQRAADARRIEDLGRRLALLERTAEPGVGPVVADGAADTLPPLPVVALAPAAAARASGTEVAQADEARVAPAVFVREPAAADATSEDDPDAIPYEGAGFGNDPGGGYLRLGATRPPTVRLYGTATQPPAPAAPGLDPAAPRTPAGGTPPSAFGDLPRIPTTTTAPGPAPAAPNDAATVFQSAMDAYRDSRWNEAIGLFDRAMAQGIAAADAAQAMFLKAEATYQTREYLAAIGLFERFLTRYPGSPRAAEAMLRVGMSAERIGDSEQAAAMYERLVREHPDSRGAALAETRIEALGGAR
jgi:TolA-binding protein